MCYVKHFHMTVFGLNLIDVLLKSNRHPDNLQLLTWNVFSVLKSGITLVPPPLTYNVISLYRKVHDKIPNSGFNINTHFRTVTFGLRFKKNYIKKIEIVNKHF